MPGIGRAVDDGTGDKLGGNSMSRAEKRVERAQEKETARKRKEQVDGRRVALGRHLCEPGLIWSAEHR